MNVHGETAMELRTMTAMQKMAEKVPDISSLTVRDLFAMCYVMRGNGASPRHAGLVRSAYDFADEMIKFRENEK